MLNVAGNALSADQQALAALSEDLTNASTPGYHAVTPNLEAVTPTGTVMGTVDAAGGPAGGVTMDGVTRATDPATTGAQLHAAGAQSYWKAVEGTQVQLQPWFAEPQTGGLQELLNQFGNAWAAYQNAPSSAASAQDIVNEGHTLAQAISTLQTQLAQVASGLESSLHKQANQVRDAAARLATANAALPALPDHSLGAATAADQARAALQQLSGLVDVRPLETADGAWAVDVGHTALVVGDQVVTDPAWQPTSTTMPTGWSVTTTSSTAWYTAQVSLTTPDGATVAVSSGTMGGTLAALDQVEQYGAQLAGIAHALASTVPTNGSSVAFFHTSPDGGLAVASGLTGASLAASVADTAQTAITGAVSQWTTLVGLVGADGQTAKQTAATTENQAQALSTAAQSVDGVNANATSAQLIQEQQAYATAARLVSVQQQNVQSLLLAVS